MARKRHDLPDRLPIERLADYLDTISAREQSRTSQRLFRVEHFVTHRHPIPSWVSRLLPCSKPETQAGGSLSTLRVTRVLEGLPESVNRVLVTRNSKVVKALRVAAIKYQRDLF